MRQTKLNDQNNKITHSFFSSWSIKKLQQLGRLESSQEDRHKLFTLNINLLSASHLNIPITRQILTEWVEKHDPIIRCLHETHFKYNIGPLKVKE